MISSRDQRRILLPGRLDQTRNPGLQDISTMVKQDQQSLPLCRQILIGACTYLVLRAHRMSQTSGWHRPWLPRGRRTTLGSDQHLEKHWPGGAKIKMTSGWPTQGKGIGGGEANGKTKVEPCWTSFIQSELSGGPINHPTALGTQNPGT